MMSARDIISSIIFYAGLVACSALLVHVGSSYAWEKVDEQFHGMEPRLPRGHYCWLNRRDSQPSRLTYGDIIMYTRPVWKRAAFACEFARVLGKPGDLIEMRGQKIYRAERVEGRLGPKEMVSEYYVQGSQRCDEFSEFIVPRNTVFVMYDERVGREQLRSLLVPVRSIFGKVIS